MTTAPSSPPDRADLPDPPGPPDPAVLARFAGFVADSVPRLIERARREVVLARFIGKLAVDQGVREVRSRLAPESTHAEPADTADPPLDGGPTGGHTPTPTPPGDAQSLALADYDHLSSAQIVTMLPGLDVNERAAIETYELAGRHRRTVLGKLEQLRSST